MYDLAQLEQRVVLKKKKYIRLLYMALVKFMYFSYNVLLEYYHIKCRSTLQSHSQIRIPYSGKFLRGRNFCNFHNQKLHVAHENEFSRKFLSPKNFLAADKLRKPSTMSSNGGSSTCNLTENWPHWANCRNFSRPTYDQLTCSRRSCNWILRVSSLHLAR